MPRPRRPLGDDVLPSPISQSLTKPLCIAAQAGDAAAIRALLAEGRDPDEFERRAEVSVFPLFLATAGNHLAAIEALISGGCNVNQYGGPWRRTSLYEGAARGNLEAVRVLLVSGQALTELSENGDAAVGGLIVGNGNRALHGAAQNGHASIVRSLLEFGADGNAPARNGFTPLFLAARDGKVDAARSLVMNPLVVVDQVTDSGTTSLGIACRRGHPELASLLLAAGAQINAIFHDSSTALLQSCMGQYEAKARECVSVCLEAGAGHVFNSSQGELSRPLARPPQWPLYSREYHPHTHRPHPAGLPAPPPQRQRVQVWSGVSVVPQGDAGGDSLPEAAHAGTVCSGPHVSFLSAWALQGRGFVSVLAFPHRGKVTAVTVAAVAAPGEEDLKLICLFVCLYR